MSFRIFFLIQFILQVVLFFSTPTHLKGFYFYPWQVIPFLVALILFALKKTRPPFLKGIYCVSALYFLFLIIDYLFYRHIGSFSLALSTLPLFILWFIYFAKWNLLHFKTKNSIRVLAIATLSWLAYAFSFPPLPLGPLAFVLLVPWFIILYKESVSTALFVSFWAGFIYNIVNYYWIYNVMKVGPAFAILSGLFLLVSFFAAYHVLAAFVFVKIRDKAFLVILYPLFYAGLEMTRSKGDFSFPWSHLGYSLGHHLSLLQTLPWIGIFGYTTLIVSTNLLVSHAILKKRYYLVLSPLLVLGLLWFHGNYVLSQKEAQAFYIANKKESPNIAMVQPSIPQIKKWSKAYFDSVTSKTWDLVKVEKGLDSIDLLVLAETAIPDVLNRHAEQIEFIQGVTQKHQLSLFIGALDYKVLPHPKHNKNIELYNAAFLFDPVPESTPQRYIKQHLVPFSERIPFDDVFSILNYVDFGEGDFTPGTETPVYDSYQWTPYICYEAIYGDQIRDAIRKGSRLMVNITNDGWFGKSTAPWQHLNLIRYRAIENAYPVARNANSGVSVFIDSYGHLKHQTELFSETIIHQKMPLRNRITLYTRIGDLVENSLLVFFFFYLGLVYLVNQRQFKKTDH